jgi:FkbM family methyltransferase
LHKKIGLRLFSEVCKLLQGKRLTGLSIARRTYRFLYSYLVAPNDVVLADVHGQKMYLDTGDKEVSSVLLLTGVHEKYETHLFKRVVVEGMTVVDLGAHVGYYTLLAAKLVGEKGKVFAFEPDPDNFSLLLKNIQTNRYGNVFPVQKAVSNKTGTSKLYLSRENKGDHRIYDSYDSRESIEVEVTTLDAFFEDKQYPIDVIKMDIQGAEMAALQGMTKIISKNDTLMIMIEFWPEGLRTFGFSPAEFVNKLIEYGFKLYTITSQEPWTKPIDVAHIMKICENRKTINLFCQKSA